MGCSMSAIADDEDDFYDFQKKSKILNLNHKWQVYSEEARLAEKIFKQEHLTGEDLIKAVKCHMFTENMVKKSKIAKALSKLTPDDIDILQLNKFL